jgi:hypothetical protein
VLLIVLGVEGAAVELLKAVGSVNDEEATEV